MVVDFKLIDLLYLLSAVTGLVVSGVLIIYQKPNLNRYNHLLGISLGILSLAIAIGFVGIAELLNSFPHLYLSGNIMVLLFMPFSYFYIRCVVTQKAINLPDLLFFLPAIFYVVDFAPVFSLSSEEKLVLVKTSVSKNGILAFEEGWLTPPWFHLYFRHFILLGFWLLQLRLLLSGPIKGSLRRGNKHWYQWIWLYQIHQVFYLVPMMIYLVFDMNADIRSYSEKFAITSLLLLYFYLFFRPSILYGIRGVPSTYRKNERKTAAIANGAASQGLSQNHVEQLLNKIDLLMKSEQPYLIQGYSLIDLAKDTRTSYRTLSSVLNNNHGANFNEFINKQRIEFFLTRVEQGDHQNKTLEGLAMECGFNNRNSFTKAFKALKKTTPSNYIKDHHTSNSANISK